MNKRPKETLLQDINTRGILVQRLQTHISAKVPCGSDRANGSICPMKNDEDIRLEKNNIQVAKGNCYGEYQHFDRIDSSSMLSFKDKLRLTVL